MNSFLSMLGIARRAGKLVYGFDAVLEQVRKNQAALLVLAADLSERSRNAFLLQTKDAKIPCIEPPLTMLDFHNAIGRRSGILAVCDRGFANQLISLSALSD